MNVQRQIAFLLAAACLILFVAVALVNLKSAAATGGQTRRGKALSSEWAFPAGKLSGLEIANASGSLRVRTSSTGDVRIRATKYDGDAADLEQVEIKVEQQGEKVVGKVDYRANISPVSVDFHLDVPPGVTLRLNSASGKVILEDYDGTASIETGSGDIMVRDCEGEIEADTGSGDITIIYSQSLPEGDSTGLLAQIEEKWSYSRSHNRLGGNINRVSHPKLTGSGQRLFHSGSGNINLQLASQVSAAVFVETLSEKFRSDFSEIRPLRDGVRYSGQINGGGALIILTTGSGRVSLKRL